LGTRKVSEQPQSLMRSEQAIFDELATLCSSPGYIHAIAYLCFRDNMIRYSGEMKPEDMRHMVSNNRLIRTETSTLIGLLSKNEIDCRVPDPNALQQYSDETEALLQEIHQSMSAAFWATLEPTKVGDKNFNPFTGGAVLREPIFYGGESAYSFQYRDLSPKKYARDNDWLIANKRFSIETARNVVHAIGRMQDEKSIATLQAMRGLPPDQWTFLPGDTFTANEIAALAKIDISTVEKVLAAFALPEGERNSQFNALHDFNVANALPLIPLGDHKYALFHIHSLVEALYESPFYWMGADGAYSSTAMQHRGLITEEFAVDCLAHVFGKDKVHSNVDIFETKDKKVGEIDVLVLFGNRAIVLQAKSKRLTLEARRGNDGQIRDDFKKSIQDSCDQAYRCARILGDTKYTLKDGNSNEITIPMPIKVVYALCAVSDHYPALSFQARQFLTFEATDRVSPPFVLDVFTLDAMTEMLESPLQLLSYVDRRTGYSDKLMASHELTILSYHLKQNLWLSEEHDMVLLEDDISTDLDLAMLARREGIPAKRSPDGILTRFAGTTLGRFVREIEARPDPGIIDLGFMLLTLGEETVVEVSKGIEELAKRAKTDGKNHDLTVGLGKGGTGFTVHCNNDPIEIAGPALQRHCHSRKYTEHAQTWFGVCVRPSDTSLRFGLNLDYAWERDEAMDVATKNMAKAGNLSALLRKSAGTKRKIGWNEPCPCASGKKYKRCCLPR
jgi:hypothetical protein